MAKIEPIRLQKFIAQCGIASRRKAEELILGGHVKVNGKTAILGDKVLPTDKVFVRGKRIVVPKGGNYRYIMLNKPRGFITTMNDERGRKCVAQLVENVGERVYPIGRLDKDSEGMLVFTNDGDFANKKDEATFYYSYDNEEWEQIGEPCKMVFDYTRFFMGSKFAIFNYATKSLGGYIDIDYFKYDK